ncbi:MAG TPA: lytic transglycosylase domain-containing protein [Thermodesulfobacteriota bacterium]|nr:lytic transglycosylase domain-containing protein [Thermodesulfobacteriota bacterium]
MNKQIIQKMGHIGLAGLILVLNGFFFLYSEKPVVSREIFCEKIPISAQTVTEQTTIPDARSFHLTLEERSASVNTYDHWIKGASKKYSLDPALVKAVIHVESRFDPLAVSPKGAMGLMQIDPNTVVELGITDPFNPKFNIYGGVRYLREMLDAFKGDKHLALAAYNAGPNQVLRHEGVPPFKETRRYLSKVLRYQTYYKQNRFS